METPTDTVKKPMAKKRKVEDDEPSHMYTVQGKNTLVIPVCSNLDSNEGFREYLRTDPKLPVLQKLVLAYPEYCPSERLKQRYKKWDPVDCLLSTGNLIADILRRDDVKPDTISIDLHRFRINDDNRIHIMELHHLLTLLKPYAGKLTTVELVGLTVWGEPTRKDALKAMKKKMKKLISKLGTTFILIDVRGDKREGQLDSIFFSLAKKQAVTVTRCHHTANLLPLGRSTTVTDLTLLGCSIHQVQSFFTQGMRESPPRHLTPRNNTLVKLVVGDFFPNEIDKAAQALIDFMPTVNLHPTLEYFHFSFLVNKCIPRRFSKASPVQTAAERVIDENFGNNKVIKRLEFHPVVLTEKTNHALFLNREAEDLAIKRSDSEWLTALANNSDCLSNILWILRKNPGAFPFSG